MPNKALIQEWIGIYGEDSDFVRVRVRGLPPRSRKLRRECRSAWTIL